MDHEWSSLILQHIWCLFVLFLNDFTVIWVTLLILFVISGALSWSGGDGLGAISLALGFFVLIVMFGSFVRGKWNSYLKRVYIRQWKAEIKQEQAQLLNQANPNNKNNHNQQIPNVAPKNISLQAQPQNYVSQASITGSMQENASISPPAAFEIVGGDGAEGDEGAEGDGRGHRRRRAHNRNMSNFFAGLVDQLGELDQEYAEGMGEGEGLYDGYEQELVAGQQPGTALFSFVFFCF